MKPNTNRPPRLTFPLSGLCFFALALSLLSCFTAGGSPILITNSTIVTSSDMAYEQAEIFVSGATLTVQGNHAFGMLSVTNHGTFSVEGGSLAAAGINLFMSTGWLHNAASLNVTSNLCIATNSVIWCEGKNRGGMVNGQWAGVGVTIEAANITVDASSKISTDGLGYTGPGTSAGNGPGRGGQSLWWHDNSGGGGYGGYGANGAGAGGGAGIGGGVYGVGMLPRELGSSGGPDGYAARDGGSGGGAICLKVADQLNLDGTVSAQGGNGDGSGGGGSGGAILVETTRLSGIGVFRAPGGNSSSGSGGGGGGGRIAVYYLSSTFSGTDNCTVAGGTGYQAGQRGTLGFFDTTIWGNHLHVYGRFTFESGDDQRPALITVEPGGELVLANGETWSLIDRLTLNPGATFAVERGSHLTTAGLTNLENLNLAVRNDGVLDVVGDVTLGAGAHITVSAGSAAQVSGLLHVGAEGVLDFQAGSSLSVTGGLLLEGTANVTFGGDVFVGENGYINTVSGSRCTIKGNFTGSTKNSFNFAPSGTCTFNGGRTATNAQLLEVMSADRGPAAPNFTRNFAFGAIVVTNTCLRLTNQYVNVVGATNEAIYAQSLVVATGAKLDLAGFHVYVRQVQLAGTVTNGTITQIPDSGPVVRNAGTPGTISLPGELDEWTFYGRAGETLVVAVNTGPGGAFGPVAPQIGYAEVLVRDPGGQVVGSAASTASNQIVTVTGLILPANGQYRVHVHAPADHNAASGNYTIAVWDAIVQQFPLALNQQHAGTLPPPYSEDRWTFAASAGQQIRFTPLNASAGALKFDLVGPGGWLGFSNVVSESDFVTLPSSGTYTLVARGSGGTGNVAYSFKIQETTVIELPTGTSYAGEMVGAGQAMLFKIHLEHSSPLRVSVGAGLRNYTWIRFCIRYGQPPGLWSYDFVRDLMHFALYDFGFGSPSPTPDTVIQESEGLVVPMAAAGDWYVLAYAYSAWSGSTTFTVSAQTGDVLLESISSSRLAGNVEMNFTLKGCGFKTPAQVTLVGSGGAEYAASDAVVLSSTQISATFAPNSVPAGTYSVRVSTGATLQDTLSGNWSRD